MGDPKEGGGDDDASDRHAGEERAGAGGREDPERFRPQDIHLRQRGHTHHQLSED